MKRASVIFLIFVSVLYVKGGNTQDYTRYHQYINKAENCFYIHNQVDSCLHYYNLAFDNFAFNYVHDLVNAAQIAYFSKKEYKSYLHKAYRYGLQVKHLKQIPLFKSDCIDEFEKFEQTSSYRKIRNKYLKSINVEHLDWMYEFTIEDQIKKSSEVNDYVLWWDEQIKVLTAKINQYGFPANKTIGIESKTIFEELGIPNKDMKDRVLTHKDKDILCGANYPDFVAFGTDTIWIEKKDNIDYCLNVEDDILSVSLVMYCLIHYGGLHEISRIDYDTVYKQLQTIWLQEIRKGNLHPREMAVLHDNMHLIQNTSIEELFGNRRKGIGVGEIFGLDAEYSSLTYDNLFKINEFRKKYNIVPVEVDAKKKEYEKEYGFKLFWGAYQCL